jgi:hypothetical protein
MNVSTPIPNNTISGLGGLLKLTFALKTVAEKKNTLQVLTTSLQFRGRNVRAVSEDDKALTTSGIIALASRLLQETLIEGQADQLVKIYNSFEKDLTKYIQENEEKRKRSEKVTSFFTRLNSLTNITEVHKAQFLAKLDQLSQKKGLSGHDRVYLNSVRNFIRIEKFIILHSLKICSAFKGIREALHTTSLSAKSLVWIEKGHALHFSSHAIDFFMNALSCIEDLLVIRKYASFITSDERKVKISSQLFHTPEYKELIELILSRQKASSGSKEFFTLLFKQAGEFEKQTIWSEAVNNFVSKGLLGDWNEILMLKKQYFGESPLFTHLDTIATLAIRYFTESSSAPTELGNTALVNEILQQISQYLAEYDTTCHLYDAIEAVSKKKKEPLVEYISLVNYPPTWSSLYTEDFKDFSSFDCTQMQTDQIQQQYIQEEIKKLQIESELLYNLNEIEEVKQNSDENINQIDKCLIGTTQSSALITPEKPIETQIQTNSDQEMLSLSLRDRKQKNSLEKQTTISQTNEHHVKSSTTTTTTSDKVKPRSHKLKKLQQNQYENIQRVHLYCSKHVMRWFGNNPPAATLEFRCAHKAPLAFAEIAQKRGRHIIFEDMETGQSYDTYLLAGEMKTSEGGSKVGYFEFGFHPQTKVLCHSFLNIMQKEQFVKSLLENDRYIAGNPTPVELSQMQITSQTYKVIAKENDQEQEFTYSLSFINNILSYHEYDEDLGKSITYKAYLP